MRFLDGLDDDLRQNVLRQIRDVWTYTSTGIEGNTLTLGDTHFVLEQGLTVSGKPLKDHQEVVGHARAIELLYGLLNRSVNEQDLFALHKAVQTEVVSDIYKPNGAWKLEQNGTYAVNESDKQVFIEYSPPQDVPCLMADWLAWFNSCLHDGVTVDYAVEVYSKAHLGFVHIHPFWDGNGRMARLLSNLPLLNSGLPPIVITRESRREYLALLAQYQINEGQVTKLTGVWPGKTPYKAFTQFVDREYGYTKELISKAFEQQGKRAV